MPSPPIIRAKNLTTFATKLPFNMSVTPLQDIKDLWEVASLAMAHQTLRSQLSACLRSCYVRRPGSPTLLVLSRWTTTYWYSHVQECARLVPSSAENHTPPPRLSPAALTSDVHWVLRTHPPAGARRCSAPVPTVSYLPPYRLTTAFSSRSIGSSRRAPRTPRPAPHSP